MLVLTSLSYILFCFTHQPLTSSCMNYWKKDTYLKITLPVKVKLVLSIVLLTWLHFQFKKLNWYFRLSWLNRKKRGPMQTDFLTEKLLDLWAKAKKVFFLVEKMQHDLCQEKFIIIKSFKGQLPVTIVASFFHIHFLALLKTNPVFQHFRVTCPEKYSIWIMIFWLPKKFPASRSCPLQFW